MRAPILTLLFTFLCTCASAQIPYYYYNIDLSLTGTALRTELSNKVTSTETAIPSYTPGVWDALKQTDLVPGGDGTKVILIYGYSDTDGVADTDRSRSKDDNGGGQAEWNREHVFPKSLGTPNLGSSGPGADVHHLRASDVSRNSSRSNRKFADGSGTSKITPQGHWYPGDEFKGDVARMVLYMYLRYGNRCLPGNVAIGSTNASDTNMIDLLLEWNSEDPVSALEDQRNSIVQGIQGNRNPFIDNPTFATVIWGGPQAEDRFGDSNPNYLCGNTVSSFPYAESFESGFGNWTNPNSGVDFNWSGNSGGTPSGGTGPGSAYEGSQYLYMESSAPNYPDKRAILYSPCFDLPDGSAIFTYKFHMYGAPSMGNLKLQISINGGADWGNIATEYGNMGNYWTTGSVDLSDFTGQPLQPIQLRFNGVTGNTWQGDMAIDDLRLTTGPAGSTHNIVLQMALDDYPGETSWTLENDVGTILNSGGTYGHLAGGSSLYIPTFLPDGCYTFTINDAYGDGMCCDYGNGSYYLSDETNFINIAFGGSFGSSVSHSFCLGGANRTAPDAPSAGLAPEVKDMSFHPNPAHDQISVSAPAGTTYRITSQAGSLLQQGKAGAVIDLSNLPSGTYLLSLINGESLVTKVLVRR